MQNLSKIVQNLLKSGALSFIGAKILISKNLQNLLENGAKFIIKWCFIFYWCQIFIGATFI